MTRKRGSPVAASPGVMAVRMNYDVDEIGIVKGRGGAIVGVV